MIGFLQEILGKLGKLDQILKEQQKIVAALDDLKGAVADLGTSISNELAAVTAKLSNPSGTSDADIQAVVGQLKNLKVQVDAETATLTAPAAAPAPAPAPEQPAPSTPGA